MKHFLIVLTGFLLIGCTPETTDITGNFVLPNELSDCKIFYMRPSDVGSITVARCPNSTTSTTYSSGKTTHTTIVVDGVEYIKKEENEKD